MRVMTSGEIAPDAGAAPLVGHDTRIAAGWAVDASAYRVPLSQPVVTSFGAMADRPAVLVRVRDRDGASGWGEVWCNFPRPGAEHRARLVNEVLAALVASRSDGCASPEHAWAWLSARTHVLALQCGEPGTFAQCIAAIEVALWDLLARRAGMPLWRFLGGSGRVPVYASGIDPAQAAQRIDEAARTGHARFKIKVAIDDARDVAVVRDAQRARPGARWMVDANQGWTLERALAAWRELADVPLDWLEEPITADASADDWRRLHAAGVPLAAGENLRGFDAFDAALAWLRVVQPDLGKWGGIGASLRIAARARAAGVRYCPHWLGAGVGLAASLAAADAHATRHGAPGDPGVGVAEIDVNPNPLRDELLAWHAGIADGTATLCDAPGLGEAPDLRAWARYRTA